MTRIFTTAIVHQPVERVFEYVTTAGNWPQWHPSSLGVTGATDHSAQPGEQITEDFRVAGRRGRVVWTVREREALRYWVIEGVIEGGGGGTITYTLSPREAGTYFEREFVYPTPSLWFRLLDWLVVRRQIEAESSEALRRLKQLLEDAGSAAPHPN